MRINLVHISWAVCILHNICVLWNMPEPPPDHENEDDNDEIIILKDDKERGEVRARADVLRNRMREQQTQNVER